MPFEHLAALEEKTGNNGRLQPPGGRDEPTVIAFLSTLQYFLPKAMANASIT
jgi:hypothetical protein